MLPSGPFTITCDKQSGNEGDGVNGIVLTVIFFSYFMTFLPIADLKNRVENMNLIHARKVEDCLSLLLYLDTLTDLHVYV